MKYICLPQYTLTCAFLGIAAIAVLMEMPDKNNIKHIILATLLSVASFSIRSKCFYLLIPVIILVAVLRTIEYDNKKIWKKYLPKYNLSGVFNIGSGYGTSTLDIAEHIVKAYKSKSKINLLKEKPEDKSIFYYDINKAKEQLDFEPEYNLESAFSDLLK